MTRVKICGITSVTQAQRCAEFGVDALGVNFVSSSPRRVDENTAAAIVRAVGSKVLVVGVVAGLDVAQMRSLRGRTGVGCLQLHGEERITDVTALLPHAYKAVRIAAASDVALAEAMPGVYVMVDAKVDGTLGGTGRTFDWSLVASLATKRRLVLAGGLSPENVAHAVACVRPFCVDVASGVEKEPGVKDWERVKAFVDAVRIAA